ncbi:unnamed protein product, partial [Rotaria sordida]
MSEDLKQPVPEYFAYLKNIIEDLIKQLPLFIAKWIVKFGLRGALDINYDITRIYIYTPPWYDEELQAFAIGSDILYEDIRRLNLFPELIKAACNEKAPIVKYVTATTYHPNSFYKGYVNHFYDYYKQEYTTSHAFANFGYAGLIGLIGANVEVSI